MCKVECRVDDDDGIFNVNGWSLSIPLSLWGLKKWLSPKNSCPSGEDLKAHWNVDGGLESSSLYLL